MVLIAALILVSLALSTTFVRRLIPSESFVAIGLVAVTLLVLLQTGHLS